MSFTYELDTDIGRFRAIFPDTVAASPVFQDEQVEVFLALEGDVRRARARALLVAAADIDLTLRVTEVLGLRVDGAAAARELRLQAEAEYAKADAADARSGDGLFDIAEWAIDPFGAREILANDLMRSGV